MAYYYFEHSYETEITAITETLKALKHLKLSSFDKKILKTISPIEKELKTKIYEIFKDIEPNEEGIKILKVNDSPSTTNEKGTMFQYHCTGLFIASTNHTNDPLFLDPFDFTPPEDEPEENTVNIPMNSLFTTNSIMQMENKYRRYYHTKSEEKIYTSLPENFSNLLYNYIMYIADGSKSTSGENSLVRLKASLHKFKKQLTSRSLDDLKPIFDKLEEYSREITELSDKCDKYSNEYNTEYYNNNFCKTQSVIDKEKKYNECKKRKEEMEKSFKNLSTIILKELKLCKQYENRVSKAIGFAMDTHAAQGMYTSQHSKHDVTIDHRSTIDQKPEKFTHPFLTIVPDSENGYICLSNSLIRKEDKEIFPARHITTYGYNGYKYVDNPDNRTISYIEQPNIHIPYMSKDDVQKLIDNFKENIVKEEFIYNNKPATPDKYEYTPNKEFEIAYYASIATKDFINGNCEIKIVPNTDIIDLLYIKDENVGYFHINGASEDLYHYRFGERTSMCIPTEFDRYYSFNTLMAPIMGIIHHYDIINTHMINMIDECIETISKMQEYLSSIDDDDFKNYLIKIKMIEKPQTND